MIINQKEKWLNGRSNKNGNWKSDKKKISFKKSSFASIGKDGLAVLSDD
jgi:hypothetical protein